MRTRRQKNSKNTAEITKARQLMVIISKDENVMLLPFLLGENKENNINGLNPDHDACCNEL